MAKIRTSRLYARLSDLGLSSFTGGTIAGFTSNLKLPDPPVLPETLALQKTAFDKAILAASGGGTFLTTVKDAARVVVVTSLDKNASYVDIKCDNDITILLSSGYQAVSTNRAQSVLNAPEIIAATYGQTGEIKLRIAGDPNRKAILGRIKPVGGEFGPVITFEGSRKIIFGALAAGTTYVMQLCGLGGSTGQSDWSAPVTKIAV